MRADASIEMGTGHVMRCLALADFLREKGATIRFISRELSGHLAEFIGRHGFEAFLLPKSAQDSPLSVEQEASEAFQKRDAEETQKVIQSIGGCDCLIVDNYVLSAVWERAMRSLAGRIFVIDDLANRRHDCDGLLDQNLHKDMKSRYDGIVSPECRLFLGPEYALLRREFIHERARLPFRDGRIRQVLINFGGSDAHDMASLAVMACEKVFSRTNVQIHVIAGGSNPNKAALQRLCASLSSPEFIYHEQVFHMARLMATSDLAIGAGGSSHWERCFLGLAAVVITTAENQVEITKEVAKTGACVYAGDVSHTLKDELLHQLTLELKGLSQDSERLAALSQNAFSLMAKRDGFETMLNWLVTAK